MRFLAFALLLALPVQAQRIPTAEQVVEPPVHAIRATFELEIYHERAGDAGLALEAASALRSLVAMLAPHVRLVIHVGPAAAIGHAQFAVGDRRYRMPFQTPARPAATSLLLTHEPIGAQGLAGPGHGCVSVPLMLEKRRKGGDPGDILVHEWLHTIVGRRVGPRAIPHPHDNARHGFARALRKDAAGDDNWDEWYAYALR